jgi:hypothetical protein
LNSGDYLHDAYTNLWYIRRVNAIGSLIFAQSNKL